jgi:hypothetical protein
MLRRLLFGLILGLVVGGLVAAGVIFGLKLTVIGDAAGLFFAYVAAALTGLATGLVTGKPVWATNAKVEATLKAIVGGLLGAGALFALRQWGGSVSLDLGAYGPGPAAIGALPAASLPAIAAVLGALFGLDNTDPPDETKPAVRARVAGSRASRARVSSEEADDGADEVAAAPPRAKR